MRIFRNTIWLLVSMPIRFYLWFVTLKAINVDRLVWFLFWVYVPVVMVCSITEVALQQEDQKKALTELKKGLAR